MMIVTTFCRDCSHLDGQTCKHPESEFPSLDFMVSGAGDPSIWRSANIMRSTNPPTSTHPPGTPRGCGPGAELFEAKAVEAAPEPPAEEPPPSPPPAESPPADPEPIAP